MPRRDGFPTSEDLLATFCENGRDIFVAALERHIENGIPLPLIGKYVSDLILDIRRSDAHESLGIRTMSSTDAKHANTLNVRLRDTEIAGSIAAEALYFSDVRFGDPLNVENLSAWGIHTIYRSQKAKVDHTSHVSIAEEEPNRLALYAGISLEKDAQAYVESPTFVMAPSKIVTKSTVNGMQLSHEWRIPFRCGMIFNGYEPTPYLEHCLDKADSAYKHRRKVLADLEDIDYPEVMLVEQERLVDEAKASLDSAREALEKRKR